MGSGDSWTGEGSEVASHHGCRADFGSTIYVAEVVWKQETEDFETDCKDLDQGGGMAQPGLWGELAILGFKDHRLLGGASSGGLWAYGPWFGAGFIAADGIHWRCREGTSAGHLTIAQQRAVPKRTAPMYTVAMVIAAEILVVDEALGEVVRVLGFIYLVMIWAALRTDDVLWIDRSRFVSEIGLRGVLIRSKTSGAGRRVRELPFFVVRTASLSGHDWLGIGMDLYLRISEFFPGVQCLCVPRKDFDGFTRKYLEAATLTGWMHWLILQLRVPKKIRDEWVVDPDDPLIEPDLGTHWSGHSARHCLPSWAAAVGVDSDRRAFIGRWRAGVEVDHNAYVLTARQVVHGVQEEVLRAFCSGNPRHYLEVEVIKELVQYGEPRGIPRAEITKRHMIWRRRERVVALFQRFPMIDREIWAAGDYLTDELENPVVTLDGEEETEKATPYWVSVSRKTGFRRLRKVGGCGIDPDSVFRSEMVMVVNKDTADKKCKLCWKQSAEKVDSDSSSGSSSSTATDSDRE